MNVNRPTLFAMNRLNENTIKNQTMLFGFHLQNKRPLSAEIVLNMQSCQDCSVSNEHLTYRVIVNQNEVIGNIDIFHSFR